MFGIWYVCIWVSPFSLLIVRDKLHFHHEAVLRTKEIKMPNIISFCLFCFQDLIKMWSDEIGVASHIESKSHEEDDHEDGAADSFCPLFPFLMMKHNCVHFWRFICHMIYIVNISFPLLLSMRSRTISLKMILYIVKCESPHCFTLFIIAHLFPAVL